MLGSATFESWDGGRSLQPSELHFPGASNDRPTAAFPAGAMDGNVNAQLSPGHTSGHEATGDMFHDINTDTITTAQHPWGVRIGWLL